MVCILVLTSSFPSTCMCLKVFTMLWECSKSSKKCISVKQYQQDVHMYRLEGWKNQEDNKTYTCINSKVKESRRHKQLKYSKTCIDHSWALPGRLRSYFPLHVPLSEHGSTRPSMLLFRYPLIWMLCQNQVVWHFDLLFTCPTRWSKFSLTSYLDVTHTQGIQREGVNISGWPTFKSYDLLSHLEHLLSVL